jgi:acetate CoA/acetoacetate CoA-transferase alpha subunit
MVGDLTVPNGDRMRKTIKVAEAVARISDGASLMIGGFMAVGTPPRLIDEMVRQGKRDLTIIANDTARPGVGIGKLIDAKLVRKVITSHIGTNPETQRQMLAGEIEVELVPQGTLAERIRAGGYGLGGVLTPTGAGTLVEDGKQTLEIDGRTFLLEKPIKADFAVLYAKQADYIGNLTYALTARNFNPLMAMAAGVVLAEAQNIVPVGVIPPDAVMTPAVLVNHLISQERRHG